MLKITSEKLVLLKCWICSPSSIAGWPHN